MMAYKTTQRTQLYDFLKEHPHSYFTVKQLADTLSNTGADISISAIYRNLSDLVEAGTIKKTVKKNSREAYYRYIDSDVCRDEIHVMCSMCGKIFHMNDTMSLFIQEQLMLQHRFELDKSKTVISGVCAECRAHKS